ncbi:MAG: prepilin peptidase [Clostridia bacterium]|nr:prepilin peptidase [Clostridia bacterium]MDD4375881.1 prepilin peptidase [Clostridia bacterium]
METVEYLNILYMICFFIIGTLFGSFFSLAIYRLPRKQDILIKRSYCTSCKHELGFFDLIPVLSYIIRGAKCKYCKEKISIRYFLLEIANGLFFLTTYLFLGISWIMLITLLIYIALVLIIGSAIMKSKMTEVEKKTMNSKKGVFNIELLAAVFAFIIYYIATIYTTRNYEDDMLSAKLRSDAMNVAINVLEENKIKNFEDINTIINEKKTIEDYTYTYNLEVIEYLDSSDNIILQNAKKMKVVVNYNLNNIEQELEFETAVFEE